MYNNLNSYKRKKSQLYKTKFKKRKQKFIIALLFLSFIIFSFLTYKIYRQIRCKDLQYAVEYTLTSGNSENRLLRVQHITLKYNDNKTVIVEVSGLSKKAPHKETTITGTFKKNSFNFWNLEDAGKS